MRVAVSTFCVSTAAAAALFGVASCERPLPQQDVPVVGLGSTTPIASSMESDSSASSTSGYPLSASDGSTMEADLIRALEADQQVTVLAPVEVGEVLCDALGQAEDAAVLSFVLRENETVTAERSSYTVADGGAFTNGIGRKVWTGIVIDPVREEDEAVPRTVCMIWADACDAETFLLKVTKRNTDGTTSLLKTVPCDGPSTTHTCLVEVSVEFDESSDAIAPDPTSTNSTKEGAEDSTKNNTEAKDISSDADSSSAGDSDGTIVNTRGSEDSSYTAVIDVMVLYSRSALDTSGITAQQMETIILESLVGTNQAFVNSKVSASVNPVHIGLLPYEASSTSSADELLYLRRNDDVANLRDEFGADLVQMVGYFESTCGRGIERYIKFQAKNLTYSFTDDGTGYTNYYFIDDGEKYGYSVVTASCLDNYSHTHEFGHNLGCYHNREDTDTYEDYAHGHRHCEGDQRYETVMSYSCGTTRVNYFSNPDVDYNGEPTGTLTRDNARAIENHMDLYFPRQDHLVFLSSLEGDNSDLGWLFGTNKGAYYSYIGCYEDDNAEYPVLSGDLLEEGDNMTIEVCAEFCEGSPYFGARDGSECVCGRNSDQPLLEEVETCNSECAGNAYQTCGDRNSMSVYEYMTDASEVAPSKHRGCWTDARVDRIMGVVHTGSSTTKGLCAAMCHAFAFYGLQYGTECWCGDESTDYAQHGDSSTCDMECAGNADTLCGGYFSMAVFEFER